MTLRQLSGRAALRVLLGLVSVGLIVLGFVSEGPLAALGLAIGAVTGLCVIVMAARSGWVLVI